MIMKKKLFLFFFLPVIGMAQTKENSTQTKTLFNNQSRLFKDWSITVGGGGTIMSQGDIRSIYDHKLNMDWNGLISLDKQISHTFGISMIYIKGQTKQQAKLNEQSGVAHGYTKFDNVSVIADINFSNLMRRVDREKPLKWALHAYAGVGLIGYKTFLQDDYVLKKWPLYIEQKIGISSTTFNGGLGLKYNISRLLDIELRTMYIYSGDEEFDGGGWTRDAAPGYNLINDSYSDNALLMNLSISFKLGKNPDHLRWIDPLQLAYNRTNALDDTFKDFSVCEKGDRDNDGICDDWDRQLDTPVGARVDGAGVALDIDLDGVIDLNDKCVTKPGPIENNGCPK